MKPKKIFITGIAGFIGYHLANKLAKEGYTVVGIDNFNDYVYDSRLKQDRAIELKGITIHRADLTGGSDKNGNRFRQLISDEKPDVVVHLAAHAGVRSSLEDPREYIDNNVIGTQNLIEACEQNNIEKVIYASTSCVMEGNQLPWKEDEPTHKPLNGYGYSKLMNECQFGTSKISKTIGLRFFTVYGPWGRPDMAIFKFTNGIVNDEPIDVYNYGDMIRDFTYVDDIIQGIQIVIEADLEKNHEVFNIGYGDQVQLMDFIREIEKNLGREAKLNMLPRHPADAIATWSDTTKLTQA
jgi:Nucleoside-diphosphate-sugar epimerases